MCKLKIHRHRSYDGIRTVQLFGEAGDDKSVIVEKENAVKVLNLEYSNST